MPETKPSDEIIDLTDIIEEDDPQAADSGGTGDAGVDMSFERELEDLFSDAGPSPATGQAAPAAAPAAPADDIDALELEDMDLSGLDAAAPAGDTAALSDEGDEDVVDLTDLLDEGGSPAGGPEAEAVAAGPEDILPDLSGLGLEAEEEPLDLTLPEEPAGDDEEDSGPSMAEVAAATAGAVAAISGGKPGVAKPAGPVSGEGIDLEALDVIIAKAGGPPSSGEEAAGLAEALQAAMARIGSLEEKISGLEAALESTRTGMASLAERSSEAAVPDTAAILDELSARMETRLAAFGEEFSRDASPATDVPAALSALSDELRAFVEERLGALEADMAAKLPAPVDPEVEARAAEALRREVLTRAEEAATSLRAEMETTLSDLRAGLEEVKARVESAPSAAEADVSALSDLAGLRDQVAEFPAALEALRADVEARVTKVDQDALCTRLRMDMAAEIEKAVPAAAARIIREEIEALMREMED